MLPEERIIFDLTRSASILDIGLFGTRTGTIMLLTIKDGVESRSTDTERMVIHPAEKGVTRDMPRIRFYGNAGTF